MIQDKNFLWTGQDQQGKKVSGEIHAQNILLAKIMLKQDHIIVKSICKKQNVFLFKRAHKITTAHISAFTRQLATMIKAGLPIIAALDLLARSHIHLGMRALLVSIKTDIETGLSISNAFAKHPRVFNSLYCSLLESGELSGQLDTILERLANAEEKKVCLQRKIKKAFTYPIVIFLIATIVTGVLLVFVIPQFESLFSDFGASLPWLTQQVVNTSHLLRQSGWILILLLSTLMGLSIWTLKHHAGTKYTIGKQLLHSPILGNILKKSAITHFASTLSMTINAGMPLIDAMSVAAKASGNAIYTKAIITACQDVVSGQPLALSLKKTQLFPHLAIDMIHIGEESGQLEQMLTKIAQFYEADVDVCIDTLSHLLEPSIMVILGSLIGGLVVAMYLPIFELGYVIK